MSKRKSIVCLLIAVIAFLFVPILSPVVRAAEKEPVTLYIFHGSTCPHCQEAMAFFKKLLKNNEFKDIFQVRAIEIWNNADNSALANKACEAMGDEPINGSVPYIVVGDKTFGGYSSSSDESIKAAIKDAYDNNKEDKLKSLVGNAGELLEGEESTLITTLIVLIVAAGIIGATIYFARSEGDETEKKEEISKEEEQTKEEEKKEINTTNTAQKNNTKKSTKKKSTSKKKK